MGCAESTKKEEGQSTRGHSACEGPPDYQKLPKFKGDKECSTKGIPKAWVDLLRDIETMENRRFGAQMDGGWFATHAEYGDVFIKKFKSTQKMEAERELKVYKVFGTEIHPNAALPYMNATEQGCIVTMQEKLSGGDLFDHILKAHVEDKKPYSEDEVRKMVVWLCEGTAFLHNHAVAHRDLKSENVMGGVRDEYLKLVDFGTAVHFPDLEKEMKTKPAEADKMLKEFKDPTSDNNHGLMFSAQFSSPEYQQDGLASNPFANDVWSIGQVLYLMLMGMMPAKTSAEIENAVDAAVKSKKMSEGAKDLILTMTAPEADRCTIKEALAHSWLRTAQSQAALPEGVLSGLLKLGQTKRVLCPAKDYFVFEVGAYGSHIIEEKKMPDIYDVDHPIEIADLSEDQKDTMIMWEFAQEHGMKFYPSKEERLMVVFNAAALEKIIAALGANTRSSWQRSWQGDELNVENAESIPSNKATFDYVKAQVEAGDSDFTIQKYKKYGVFGIQMADDAKVLVSHTKHTPDCEGKVFVYTSPWSSERAHAHLHVQVGDAMVYRENVTRVHTMEKVAVEKNYTLV